MAAMSRTRWTYDFTYAAGRERFPELDGGEWHEVTGGELPHPVLIRIRETDSGELICTGLAIGATGDREVTAADLRLPVRKIVDEMAAWMLESKEDFGNLFAFVTLGNTRRVRKPPPRKPGNQPPNDATLVKFRNAYQLAFATDRRRAMKRATEAMNISVATGHRWRGLAQDRQLWSVEGKDGR
jgi:hypothetical protein